MPCDGDCDDDDPLANPGSAEESEADCSDGFDNDCDAFVDLDDEDCTEHLPEDDPDGNSDVPDGQIRTNQMGCGCSALVAEKRAPTERLALFLVLGGLALVRRKRCAAG
jgi:hypothetical protein